MRSRFQSTQDGHSVRVVYLITRQNGKCNVRTFRWFLFGMSPDVLPFKVCIFTSDFKFWNGVNELVVDILTQILLTLDFHCLNNFAKKYQFVVDSFSSVWVILSTFNLHHEACSMDNNMVSKFELECLLLIFIYSNSKFKATCKTQTLNAG